MNCYIGSVTIKIALLVHACDRQNNYNKKTRDNAKRLQNQDREI